MAGKTVITQIRRVHQFSNRSLVEYTGVSLTMLKRIKQGKIQTGVAIKKLQTFLSIIRKFQQRSIRNKRSGKVFNMYEFSMSALSKK